MYARRLGLIFLVFTCKLYRLSSHVYLYLLEKDYAVVFLKIHIIGNVRRGRLLIIICDIVKKAEACFPSTFSGVLTSGTCTSPEMTRLTIVRARRYSVILLYEIMMHILVCSTRNMVVGRILEVLGPAPLSVGFSYIRSWKFNLGFL